MKYVRANIYQEKIRFVWRGRANPTQRHFYGPTRLIMGEVLTRPVTIDDWENVFNGSHRQVWPWLRDVRWNLTDELRGDTNESD